MDTSASPTPTSSSGAVHTVDIGEDGFTYNPDTVTAAAGDKVEFHFYPGDHSVVQAAFSSPCQPLNDSSVFSGFMLGTSDGSVSLQAIYGELAANILCYHTARHLHRDY
jgi:plastocyanin